MKRLPIGIQDFPLLVSGGFDYVDKTPLLYQLIRQGVSFFLSRPRRFGKSLLVSVLAAIFSAKRELFHGLWIDSSDYEWVEHPVISLDFSNLATDSPESLLESLNEYLVKVASSLGVQLTPHKRASVTFADLIEKVYTQARVVVLIDEYDRPLIANVENPHVVQANRASLQDFFSILKSSQKYLHFVFITGVSKFSTVSFFSGMNSLDDISLDARYATLTGLTEKEIIAKFHPRLDELAAQQHEPFESLMERIRLWYNGYLFARSTTCERVFNPWSLLKFLSTGELVDHWFASGTPTFLVKLIRERNFPLIDLDKNIEVGSLLDANRQTLDWPLLLFQSGYLTIDRYEAASRTYWLRCSNEEMRRSFSQDLLHIGGSNGQTDGVFKPRAGCGAD
jgi:hypothetical protein